MKLKLVLLSLLVAVGVRQYYRQPHIPPLTHTPLVRQTGYPIQHDVIERAKRFTVLISNEGFIGRSRGTGILIDPTHVLTCAHVMESVADETWVYVYPANEVLRGRLEFQNRKLDLAIVVLNRPVLLPKYPVFQEQTGDGEPITIVGNMLGSMKWMVSYGIISAQMPPFLLTDGLIHGGNSGGPWINEAGEIVALTDWGLVKNGVDQGISGGVSAKTIHGFLKSWKHPNAMELFLRSL